MNKVTKISQNGEIKYILTCEDGQTFECKLWFEKKTGVYHVMLPKDNPTGRTYIRESRFDTTNEITFETKTEHRTLGSTNWESRLTDDEKLELENCRTRIEELKQLGMSRKPEKLDSNSEEGILAQIAKLQTKLLKQRGE